MTKEEAIEHLKLIRLNAGMTGAESFKEALDLAIVSLSLPSLPSGLDEAAEEYVKDYGYTEDDYKRERIIAEEHFKAGAEWMAWRGWIDDGSMPPETKQESDTLQGHREWTESKPVLAWDSMYGCRVDWTRNGKWMSEQTGGYTGQICHGIIAWRPIPEYKEKR